MTLQDHYKKWQEAVLKRSLEKFPERKKGFETSAGIQIPRVALPGGLDTRQTLLDHRNGCIVLNFT